MYKTVSSTINIYMSNKDIWNAYISKNIPLNTPEYTKKRITELYGDVLNEQTGEIDEDKFTHTTTPSNLYQAVVEGQMVSRELMGGDWTPTNTAGGKISKTEMGRQIDTKWSTLSGSYDTKASALRAMQAGKIGIDLGDPVDAPTSDLFTQEDIKTLNSLDRSDQIKIKNLLNKAARDTLTNLLTPYAKKKIDSVMPMIMYSDIDVGDFIEMMNASKADPVNVQLINSRFFIDPANVGVFSIQSAVISPEAKMVDPSTGAEIGANYTELVIRSLTALKLLGVGGAQAGPYEAALQLLSNGDITQEGKGDINVGGQLLELKAEGGRVGLEEWPARKDMVAIAQKAVGDAIDKYLPQLQNKQAILKQLADKGTSYDAFNVMLNNIFGDQPQIRLEIITPIVKKLYSGNHGWEELASTFASNYDDMRHILARVSFDMYKNSKTSSAEGKWSRLVAINLTTSNTIALFDTGADMEQAAREKLIKSPIPNVIATGPSAARDYMFQLDLN